MQPVIRPRAPRKASNSTHPETASRLQDGAKEEAVSSDVAVAETSPVEPPTDQSIPLHTGKASADPKLGWAAAFTPFVEHVQIETLKAPNRKTRRSSKKGVVAMKASLTEFGIVNPLVVDANNVIRAGNTRYLAAKELGVATVPVIRLSHLTDEKLRLYAIADNRLAELSNWDNDELKLEFAELDALQSIDLEITGFDLAQIENILGESGNANESDDDMEEARQIAVSRIGDVWLFPGGHRLICGNACEVDTYVTLMQGEKARLIVTDPPYGVAVSSVSGLGKHKHREFVMGAKGTTDTELATLLGSSLSAMAANTVDGGIHMVFMDARHTRILLNVGTEVYPGGYKQICVWIKPSGGMGSFYRSQHEFCVIHKVGTAPHVNNFGLGENGRYRTNCWFYEGQNSFHKGRDEELAMHPTVKPVVMIMDAIKDCSHRRDIVLDGFGGSGTTLIAAHKTQRRGYLVELDPLYVDLIVRRFIKLFGGDVLLEGDGRSFDVVSAERLGAAE